MKKFPQKRLYELGKVALARFGVTLSRSRETFVIPRPSPGPETYHCRGIDWRASTVDRFLGGPLHDYLAECEAIPGYHPDNPYFGFVDAAVAYAFVRHHRPSVVVEIGSGHSSRVLRAALDRNASGRLTAIDPEPRISVSTVCHEHLAVPVQQVPATWFADLPSDALVFIDSSHQAGTGSDVNHLLLEVLPSLKPGVLVHVHDIYLPDDYPVEWNVDRGFLYSEQYLLHALLCFSMGFEVKWPGRWLLRYRRSELAARFGPRPDLDRHCSFWLARTDASEAV